MRYAIALLITLLATAAHAQSPADFGYEWETVGDSYTREDGRIEQPITVTVTMQDQPVVQRTYPIRWEPGDPDSTTYCENMAIAYYESYVRERVVELDQYAQQTGETLKGEMYAMWSRMVERVRDLDIPDWDDMDEAEQTAAIMTVEAIWQDEAATLDYVKPDELGDYVAVLTNQGFTDRSEMWAFILMVRGWI